MRAIPFPERKCSDCGLLKLSILFNKRSNYCKVCDKKRRNRNSAEYKAEKSNYDKLRYKLPHIRQAALDRVKTPEAKAKHKEYRATVEGKEAKNQARVNYEYRHPEKHRAVRLLNQAVTSGEVIKQPCFCGNTIVEAHHSDYSKPLEVNWLCAKHHREIHR